MFVLNFRSLGLITPLRPSSAYYNTKDQQWLPSEYMRNYHVARFEYIKLLSYVMYSCSPGKSWQNCNRLSFFANFKLHLGKHNLEEFPVSSTSALRQFCLILKNW